MSYVNTPVELPRSLDVAISLSVAATASRTNLTVPCFVDTNLGMLANANRVRFYSSLSALENDFPSGDVNAAGQAFFAQTPRASTMAVGELFLIPQSGKLVSAPLSTTQIAALQSITIGSMTLVLSGIAYNVTGINFSSVLTLANIVNALTTAFTTCNIPARAYIKTLPGDDQRLAIEQVTTTAIALENQLIPSVSPYIASVTNKSSYLNNTQVKFLVGGAVLTQEPVGTILASGQYTIDGLGNYTFASADEGKQVQISYNTYTSVTGATATTTYPAAYTTGTFVGDALGISLATGGTVLQGYTPTTIADELQSVANAGTTQGQFLYGWVLSSTLRSTSLQTVAAAWALTQTAIMPLVSNDPGAYNPAYNLDIGSLLQTTDNQRCPCIFHNDPTQYPDMSILAFMLSVDYTQQDSTVTAKFKQLPGVTTVPLSTTQWSALQAKGYNAYTLMQTGILTFRDGTTENTSYYMDSTINFDNFIEDLTVNVYNVFLRNGKVHGRAGQLMLVDACNDTGEQYVTNGTFEDRQIQDTTQKSGVSTLPAFVINASSLASASAAMRASRICPPIQIICQESYVFQSVAVNVSVVE